jgi:hypothetical protein
MSLTSGPEYWWCSVGGNPPEPCTLVREASIGVVAYTAKCPDPFWPYQDDCPLKLIRQMALPRFNAKTFKGVPVPSRFHGYANFQAEKAV